MAGWYEWRESIGDAKKYQRPIYIHERENRTFYAVVLWEPRHRLQEEDGAGSATIITTDHRSGSACTTGRRCLSTLSRRKRG